ncbi:hypothetical protein V502_05445 [Pseudogymnoascus sp. VKM F-4520 (FW-2644)]|nr:hypothetical protein V502_05445 [Pseudogymnoascus sp. VKM F-4520 (FW-2644)]
MQRPYHASSSSADKAAGSAPSPLDPDPLLSESNTWLRGEESGNLPSALEGDEAADSANYAVALDSNVVQEIDQSPALMYIGDQQSASSFVFDLCNGPSQTSHYLVPRGTTRRQRPEDLNYLRLKGCFSVPSQDICEDLIRAYFLHVHPFLPIIDARHFLEDFVSHGYHNINLLLLWSMFFAATNFVDSEVLQKAGYTSRKAMKRAMYQRAKCLYDSDYEEDKVSLIQAVILMAFWYSDMEDRTGAWHWMGIAIGLCQTMGLHRNPRVDTVKQHLSKETIGLFRRIWWSCFVRDRWLSLAMGRPMRIQIEDCDTPMPTVNDVTKELEGISCPTTRSYLPNGPEKLAGLWVKLLRISDALGTMIRVFYRLKGTKADLKDMKKCEEEILQCALSSEEKGEEDHTLLFHVHQLQLFYEATIIVLHRPYLLPRANEMASSEEKSWQALSRQKAKTAATNTNVVLERLIDLDMIKCLKPMTVTALIPAMQIHLLESTSATPLLRSFGTHKLRLCMMVLSELRATYWGADSVYRLFERAEAKLIKHQIKGTAGRNDGRSGNLLPLTPESSNSTQTQFADTQDFPGSLDDPSNFLWDQFDLTAMMDGDAYLQSDPALIQDGAVREGINESPLSESMHEDYGINTLLSLEEFNSQCHFMSQIR